MINLFYETEFVLNDESKHKDWITRSIESEGYLLGEINYIFCNDDYLHNINLDFLKHDTLTDIITFDHTSGKHISGDIYISIERVKENAETYKEGLSKELKRVIIHGVLHLCGYRDKTSQEELLMRKKEEDKIKLF